MRRAASALALASVLLVLAAGCETLLGPPAPSRPQVVSLASVSRVAGFWRGTWRSTQGASGRLTVFIAPGEGGRASGTVQFAEGLCPRTTPFEGAIADGKLTVTADLGVPCGTLVLTVIESRAEESRLVGSYKAGYPESGLFAIYPR